MKLIIVLVTLYICVVDCIPPRSDPLLTSEEITQEEEPDNKMMKVVHYGSIEHEPPWLDQHLLEITPLRPSKSYSPPVAFVVGTPTHKKNQKEPPKPPKHATKPKHPKNTKRPKRKYPKKSKDPKKLIKNKKDNVDKDHYGLYTAAAYPSFQGHPVIPVIYPEVQQPHLHYLSESSEEFRDRAKKKARNHKQFRPKFDLKSASDSTEYNDNNFRMMRQKSSKSRPKPYNIKRKDKHDENVPKETSSEDDVDEKRRQIKPKNHRQSRKHERVYNIKDSERNKDVEETVTNEVEEEVEKSSESYENNGHSKTEKYKKHERSISEDTISDEDVEKHDKYKRKPHNLVTYPKSSKLLKSHKEILKSSESEEVDPKVSLEFEHSDEKTSNNNKLIQENYSSSDENENILHEEQNVHTLNKLQKPNSKENNHIEKSKEKHLYINNDKHSLLVNKNRKMGNLSNEKSEDESNDHSTDIKSDEDNSDQINSEPAQENNLSKLNSLNNLSNKLLNEFGFTNEDTSVLNENSQANNELDSPIPMFTPSWFQNNQQELKKNSNSEEKLRAEYNQNLENLRQQPLDDNFLNMDAIMNRYHKMGDKFNINRNKNTLNLDEKKQNSETNSQDNNDGWLNKIDEIINMLRDEKYGKITEDPNNDGIFVTKHNPKTGVEDENSIFITKIVHTLDDDGDSPNKVIPKKDPKQVQHIYEIANHPKYNETLEPDDTSKENIILENFDNKTESLNDIVLSTEDTIPDVIPMDISDHIPHYDDLLASEELLFQDLQNQQNLADLINDYDQYVDTILHDYDDILHKNEIPNDLNLIPNPSLQGLADSLPNTNEFDKENIDKHEDLKYKEPLKINSSFVFDGKVDSIYIMKQDNNTDSDNDNLHKHSEREHSISSEESSNWLSLETNEHSIENINTRRYNNQKPNFLEKTKAADNHFNLSRHNLRDINIYKDGKITLHINEKRNNVSNPTTNHHIEITHNKNEEHASSEIISEIIDDIENLAQNFGHDIKYIINDCESTTMKNIENNQANKTYNLSFLFNKR